jgi:tetratricopeptide (TPR) repeat protein
MVLTWAQTGHWEDNFTLWGHALEAAPSALAHNEMGVALWRQGDRRLAVAHFRAALRLDPRQPQANANLARVLALQGHTGEAAAHWREACRLLPRQYQGDYPPPPPGMERWPGAPAAGTGGP